MLVTSSALKLDISYSKLAETYDDNQTYDNQTYDNPSFSNKRPVDEADGYEQHVTKRMRVEAGEGPNTILRILVNSKVCDIGL